RRQFCEEHCYHRDCLFQRRLCQNCNENLHKKASAENFLRAVQRDRTRTAREGHFRQGRAAISKYR
ncbi:unnamed protein product, partial [Hymenolepis diminuta]